MKEDSDSARLKLEQRRYKIALQALGDYIFEYDAAGDVLTDYSSCHELGDSPLIRKKFLGNLKDKECCDSKQLEQLEDFMLGRRQTAEIKIYRQEKGMTAYDCYSFSGQPIYEKDELVKIVGKISDITHLKESEERLQAAVYKDGLTGAYIPARGLYLLEEFFRKQKNKDYALIYMDIVNMSTINSAYSMPFGNAILKFTADKIKEYIGREDIFIRIGGCQFMVLCKNTDKENTRLLIRRLIAIPDVIYTGDIEEAKEKIGIAVIEGYLWEGCPDLPKVAEKMKEELDSEPEKDMVHIEPEKLPYLYDDIHIYREYKDYQGISFSFCKMRQDLITYSFDLLEKTKDMQSAIRMLLYTVGNVMAMSYIRIYEVDYSYLTKSLLYQWNAKKADYDTVRIVKYPNETTLAGILDVFSKKGAFEVTDREAPDCPKEIMKYIKSEYPGRKLYAKQMLTDRRVAGFVVYASDKAGEWREEEKKFYDSLTRLLAVHIDKARSDSANRAKTEFLSRMSHEIRTPINGIVGMTEILKKYLGQKNQGQKKTPIDEKIDDCLKKIDTSTAFLISIIDDILEMAKIESGKLKINMEPFAMEEIADKLEAVISGQLKGMDFELCREYDKIYVMGDAMRIMQVLMKLVGNALKFTPEKGKITVCLKQMEQSEEGVLYRISVKDTGCGICEEDKEIIFHSFMQANADKKRNYDGMGLGLTISQSIVSMLGGRLELESAPGQGAEFYFSLRLPYARREERKENSMTATESARRDYSGRRILLAEDNTLNAEIAETIFSMWGFEVDKAADGIIAADKFTKSEAGYYSAVIMDIRMPNMDGLAATRAIRVSGHKDARRIPIIALTSDAFDEDMEKAISCGMNGYLAKPVRPDKIREILERVII